MRVVNTLGRVAAEFEPLAPPKVGIYVCGPTVQSAPHLGHGRSAVAFDVIRRYLTWRGFDVTFVRNVTDVEDKIIAAAAEQGISTEELVAETAKRFDAAERALGVLEPTIAPKATEHIPEMIALIETLISKEHAYAVDGDVYFSVRSLPDYGKLSGRNLDDLQAGARVEVDERKRDPADFALWKAAKPGEPSWESPWGVGRPGWHIECSAMAQKYLGDTLDIHGGGTDLIFPHHENEIAQSEAATGAPFARYWLHNEMLNLRGEKMSKSTGHVVDLLTAVERWKPMAVRLFYLRAHYRSPIDFSEELLDDAAAAYERLLAFVRRAGDPGTPDAAAMEAFTAAMDDDFNTPEALAVVFDTVKVGNRRLDAGKAAAGEVAAVRTMLEILGVDVVAESVGAEEVADVYAHVCGGDPAGLGVAEMMEAVIAARSQARATRDWATADEIRDRLAAAGIVLEDTPDGVRWHRA